MTAKLGTPAPLLMGPCQGKLPTIKGCIVSPFHDTAVIITEYIRLGISIKCLIQLAI